MADTALQRQPMDPMDLLQLAIAKEGSVDVIERLAALQIQFQERADRQEFAEAFMKFKQSAPKVLKTKFVDYPNSKGGRTQYWHVEIDKAADILGPALLAVGLTYSWKTEDLPDGRSAALVSTEIIARRAGTMILPEQASCTLHAVEWEAFLRASLPSIDR